VRGCRAFPTGSLATEYAAAAAQLVPKHTKDGFREALTGTTSMTDFSNYRGYSTMFKDGEMSLGFFFATESFSRSIPEMNI
jgi:hypothetical protein